MIAAFGEGRRLMRVRFRLCYLAATFGLLALSDCTPLSLHSSLRVSTEQPAGCALLQSAERYAFVLYEVSKKRLTACNPLRAARRGDAIITWRALPVSSCMKA
jgi:hypothetical protein